MAVLAAGASHRSHRAQLRVLTLAANSHSMLPGEVLSQHANQSKSYIEADGCMHKVNVGKFCKKKGAVKARGRKQKLTEEKALALTSSQA